MSTSCKPADEHLNQCKNESKNSAKIGQVFDDFGIPRHILLDQFSNQRLEESEVISRICDVVDCQYKNDKYKQSDIVIQWCFSFQMSTNETSHHMF